MNPAIKVAVVGHTNTGKTSLLRTLTRDASFGAIANRPSTTRHVEGAALLVDGRPLIAFYDTPGLEDSIGLLEHLETLPDADWVARLERFPNSPEAQGDFTQEAKVLRQVLSCDIVLYVIDVRERVLGKYRDELTLLIRSARPVIPLLNFVESPDARIDDWRRYLLGAGLHAQLTFNPLVIDAVAERKLFEKMRALHDELYQPLARVIEDLERQRDRLRRIAADRIADLLLDVAAHSVLLPEEQAAPDALRADLERRVREREIGGARELLRLFGFNPADYTPETLLFGAAGRPALDLAELRELGIQSSGGAAAGAAAGLAADAMLAGLSLGVGTATGAALGALYKVRHQGGRLMRRWRGQQELWVADDTLIWLGARQLALARALLRRGHADPNPVRLETASVADFHQRLLSRPPPELAKARFNPDWSRLDTNNAMPGDGSRETARTQLATGMEAMLADESGRTPA